MMANLLWNRNNLVKYNKVTEEKGKKKTVEAEN